MCEREREREREEERDFLLVKEGREKKTKKEKKENNSLISSAATATREAFEEIARSSIPLSCLLSISLFSLGSIHRCLKTALR